MPHSAGRSAACQARARIRRLCLSRTDPPASASMKEAAAAAGKKLQALPTSAQPSHVQVALLAQTPYDKGPATRPQPLLHALHMSTRRLRMRSFQQDRSTHSAADARGHSRGTSRGAVHRRLPKPLRGRIPLGEQPAPAQQAGRARGRLLGAAAMQAQGPTGSLPRQAWQEHALVLCGGRCCGERGRNSPASAAHGCMQQRQQPCKQRPCRSRGAHVAVLLAARSMRCSRTKEGCSDVQPQCGGFNT
jgi:hypothetical protein